MKVYLVLYVMYIDEYESHDEVLGIFDSEEKAAKFILNTTKCTSISISELINAEQLIVDCNDHFYTNNDDAPEYNLEFYTIDEYEVE